MNTSMVHSPIVTEAIPVFLFTYHVVSCVLPGILIIFQQKLEERMATLSKVKFADPKDKGKWEKVLILELMSSEDSGTDDDDDILVVRPLPWRSSKVDQMFKELDKETLSGKSPRSRRQMKQRKTGNPSKRPQCSIDGVPRWAFSS